MIATLFPKIFTRISAKPFTKPFPKISATLFPKIFTKPFLKILPPFGKRSRPIHTLLICGLCMLLGLGLSLVQSGLTPRWSQAARAQNQPLIASTPTTDLVGTLDPIPSQYQLGADLYLESCASCHVGVPPQTLPIQTWQHIIEDPEHYGVRIPPLIDPPRLLIWQYVSHFSRSIKAGESIPYHVSTSRYFKALHPRVDFEQEVTLHQCITCHPGANSYNFRQLTSDWNDAP